MPAYKPLKLVGSCSASAGRRAPSKWFAHRRLQNPGRPSKPSRHWRGNVSVEQRAEAGFNSMIMPPSILSGAVFCTHASFRTATAVPVHVKAAAYVLVRVSPSNVRCSPSFGSGSRRAACQPQCSSRVLESQPHALASRLCKQRQVLAACPHAAHIR